MSAAVAKVCALLLVVGSVVGSVVGRVAGGDVRDDAARRVERWREALELDLGAEIVAEARPIASDVEGDPVLASLLARALHASGETERALALLAKARERAPDAAAPSLALARVRLDLDELSAVDELLRAPAGAPAGVPAGVPARVTAPVRFADEPESWLLAGRARARRGDLAGAAPLFERFVALAPLSPDAPSAWHVLVSCALAAGDAERAQRYQREGEKSALWHGYYRARRLQIRARPDEPLPRVGLVELWLAANEPARAVAEARTVVERWPKFARGRASLGESLARSGADAEARAAFEAALALDEATAEAHLGLARLLSKSGDTQRSDEHFARYRALGGKQER